MLEVFDYQGQQVRTDYKDEAVWFVAADVCRVLDIINPTMAVGRLDDDEKGLSSIETLGGNQQMVVVNEAGLYSLILTSRKPQAKEFKRWVTHDVLPSIRKHGLYRHPFIFCGADVQGCGPFIGRPVGGSQCR